MTRLIIITAAPAYLTLLADYNKANLQFPTKKHSKSTMFQMTVTILNLTHTDQSTDTIHTLGKLLLLRRHIRPFLNLFLPRGTKK